MTHTSFDQAYCVGWRTSDSAQDGGIWEAPPAPGQTLAQLFDRHHDVLWEEGTHKYGVSGFIRELDRLLGSKPFSDFPQERLDHLTKLLRRRGNTNATINRKLSALGKLLKKAAKMGEIRSLPEIRRLKERVGRLRFLDHDEETRLFGAIRRRSELYYHLCIFLVDSGARLGEAIGLRWIDIEDGRASFWITKSGRSRTVPLTKRVMESLQACRDHTVGPFCTVKQYQYRLVWHEAKREVGLHHDRDVIPHALRHTCASRLVRGGVDIRRVQTWLGHQTLQMTLRYAHLATHDLDACLAVLESEPVEHESGR